LGDRCAASHSPFHLSSLTQAQKPRYGRVSQVGRVLYSQPSIQDVLQGTVCLDPPQCSVLI
jgi:hypothetical protein